MITLYGPARSSAGRCFWCLEEIGIPYEHKNVNLMTKEHREEWFLKLNPNGKVPVLVDGNITLFESMAINYYLAEKYKPELLGKTVEEKAISQQWGYWATSELQSPIIEIFIQKVFVPEDRRNFTIIEENEKKLPGLFAILDQTLSSKKYLNGDEFTMADLNVASVATIAPMIGFDMAPYTKVNAWLNAMMDRPSYKRYTDLRKS